MIIDDNYLQGHDIGYAAIQAVVAVAAVRLAVAPIETFADVLLRVADGGYKAAVRGSHIEVVQVGLGTDLCVT